MQSAATPGFLERYFGIAASGSTVGREIRAGLTTFLTMSYILFVNPDILSQAIRVPNAFAQLLFATAIAAAIGSIMMGLVARYPFALAPGMGLNAYFAFSVVIGQGVPWQVALGAVFIEGLLFLALSFGGIRQAIITSLPNNLKFATSAGIGLFLAIIGLKNAGIVVDNPSTLVALGALTTPSVLIALFGLLVTAVLMVRRVPGAILFGIVGATLLAIITRAPVYAGPEGKMVAFAGLNGSPVQLPVFPTDLFLAMDLQGALGLGILGIVFTFLFVSIFDTAGTLVGLSAKAGYLDEKGNLPRANQAFATDAIATSAGAAFGTSTTTAYVESASGIEEGGRTGLTAVVVGVLFLLALFLWPLAAAVPSAATAPALILVGALMASNLRLIEWDDYADAIPAFLTVALMPLTYSIANGISFGIISYAAIRLFSGRGRQVHWVMYLLAALLLVRYIWFAE
ncbi:AGZA family xanthine/uracil permease-like MFS transporter [Deinobacterium chartae]|uniref:AGZA family xanthine/uracil permease-like MFS transporter n=1 Tax=Deinobacterium chartae TaxID=521158 RepID=A0A841HWM4_9DEIO|nr:NCS2 family permease [Deinobacterium chartae]MBB6096649.1 AGZA family xanthine/uracil permease-like MFS transporter [Deinobacterium chartae]